MELNWKLISDLVGFAASLIAILGAMIVVVKWMKSHKDGMSYFLNYSRHNFFYPRTLANRILKENLMKPLGDSKFIDYGSAISKGFYSEDVAEMEVLCNDGKKTISIPYKVEINYIERPNAKIVIKDRNLHDAYQLSEAHKKETEPLLQAFLEAKKNTTDDRTLRIKSIEQVTENVYECDLQLATYYDQVRTNLTIDMPLGVGRTMRLEDLSGTKQLKKLSESILANTIGVSAIWIMPYKKGDKKNSYKVFLKPRKTETGVFYDMLGTISGVVEPPKSNVIECDTLEEYVTSQIKKEFFQEVGYNRYLEDTGRDESEVEIIPLAYVRELMRGGKPQFFFLIKTPETTEKVISKYFKESFNGTDEFKNNIISQIKEYNMSPETQANMLFAYSYIQSRQNLGYVDISD